VKYFITLVSCWEHLLPPNAFSRILENIVTTPADADIGSILGIGFPPYTGGVLSYIDMTGVKQFVEECNELADKYGNRFKPTDGLKEMAAKGKRFYNEY